MLLPKGIWRTKPKIIYIARNPKDVAVSYFQQYVTLHGYQGTLDDFLDLLIGDSVVAAPFHSHITDFWDMQLESNILFIRYEEYESNLPLVIRTIATFLEKSLSDNEVDQLTEHLNNQTVPVQLESKTVWRNSRLENSSTSPNAKSLTEAQAKRIDDWNTAKLYNTDLSFDH